MIRTLVIDDEPFLRQYIKNCIVSLNPAFTIIGEAGNGEEAWRKITETTPDVIFIDIKMPLVDGLEVLERCSRLKKSPLSVVLSGYSEFSYAQKALKHHAFDYILKPVNQEALGQLLKRIETGFRKRMVQMQYRYFLHLLHNQNFPHSREEISAAFSGFDCFCAYYVCIGSHSTCRYNQFNTIGDFWKNMQFDRRVSRAAAAYGQVWIIHEEPQNDCLLILGGPNGSGHAFLPDIQAVLEDSPYPATIIHGPESSRPEQLKDRIIELYSAASAHIIFSRSGVCDLAAPPSLSNDLSFFSYAEQNILRTLVSDHKFGDFQQQTEKYLSLCESQGCRQCALSQLLKRICEIADQNRLSFALQERIDELITNSMHYRDIRNGMADLLSDIFHTFSENTGSSAAIQIKTFIDQHYTEQISLTRLADKFNFSISHLSSLFKKTYQISPNEYIIRLRIERAKALLTENRDTSVRRISELIGYTDPYYFSRLFKMSVGCTPSDYRNSHTDSESGI